MTGVRILDGAAALAPDQAGLLQGLLELQASLALGQGPERGGFLATTWSLAELRGLLAEGAYLALAEDAGGLQGYALLAPIRHLPQGEFRPEPDSPIRCREDLDGPLRFVYGYQIAVRPERFPGAVPVSVQIMKALTAEHDRRGIHSVSCVMLAPRCNQISLAFLTAMGLRRIATLHDPEGPPLLPGPATWACMVRLPLSNPTTRDL
jgi:hypothetical protein